MLTTIMAGDESNKSVLSYFNLSDSYEVKARFIPGILSVSVLLPVGAAFGVALSSWLKFLVAGVGIWAAAGVALSYLASAMGNRIQKRLWPRWPYDGPTNTWLLPTDKTRSAAQKQNWYAAILRLTKLDIAAAANGPGDELEKLIDDAVTELRSRLWRSKHSARLQVHNTDYGFARNFTGLRSLWVPFSVASCIGCWVSYFSFAAGGVWPVLSTVFAAAAVPIAFVILPEYVQRTACQYAESFFGALMALDRELEEGKSRKD